MKASGEERKPILYMHAGSGNHGCEAIVNSLCAMLPMNVAVVTNDAKEDEKYSLGEICDLWQERRFGEHRLMHVLYYLYRKVTGDAESFIRFRYRKAFQQAQIPLAISIGGDNYCYDNMLNDLRLANRAFNQAGTKTILLGCSIEPELLKNQAIREDLSQYQMIIARESITYEALLQMQKEQEAEGKTRLPDIRLYPDSAFTLKTELPVSQEYPLDKDTIGINISPMIQDNESEPGITMRSYQALIQHILDTTQSQIALIPHVVWARNDDRVPITQLYEKYQDTGRVMLISDRNCMQLKGIISQCRMFVGARTHATIAAYSSLVPTLVVGYSVKARGIARDLFGTEEHYVIPVQLLGKPEQLIAAYDWLAAHEKEMRQHLEQVMPAYQEQAMKTGKEVERLWEELS